VENKKRELYFLEGKSGPNTHQQGKGLTAPRVLLGQLPDRAQRAGKCRLKEISPQK